MQLIEDLAAHWSKQGCVPDGGATAEMVRSFELANNRSLPGDFKEYLERLNGLAEFGRDADEKGFGFLPLRQLRPATELEYPPGFDRRGYFVFAQYLDWSWGYAIQLIDRQTLGEVIHILTLAPKIVAPSFSAFIALYLADSGQMYPEAQSSPE